MTYRGGRDRTVHSGSRGNETVRNGTGMGSGEPAQIAASPEGGNGPGVAGTTVGFIALAAAAIPYVTLFAWVFGLVGFGMGLAGSMLNFQNRVTAYIALGVSTVAIFVSILATIEYVSKQGG